MNTIQANESILTYINYYNNFLFSEKYRNQKSKLMTVKPDIVRLFSVMNLFHPFGMEHAFLVDTFIGVRTEVVALRLDQVRRQHRGAVAVVVGDRSREGRRRNTVLHGVSHHVTQRLLVLVGDLLEVWRQQQVGDIGIRRVSVGDLLQELGADDAAGAEDLGDFAIVQIPVVFFRRGFQLREALRV